MVGSSTAASKAILLRHVKAPKKEEKEKAHNVNQINSFVVILFHVTFSYNNFYCWLDTGATYHASSNKNLFSMYVATKESASMPDRSTANVLGIAIVVLTLTSGKAFTLKSVKHVPLIFKNLVPGSLLCDAGMRLNFLDCKVVLFYKKIYLAMLIALMAYTR